MLAPPSLRAIHPLGKSPLVQVDDVILAESGLIIEFLLDRFDNGRFQPPPSTPEQALFTPPP